MGAVSPRVLLLNAVFSLFQDASNSAQEVYDLRSDLEVLADAFNEKESEAFVLQSALNEAEQQYHGAQIELQEAQENAMAVRKELAAALEQLGQAQVGACCSCRLGPPSNLMRSQVIFIHYEPSPDPLRSLVIPL